MSEEPKWRKRKSKIIENHQNMEHDEPDSNEEKPDSNEEKPVSNEEKPDSNEGLDIDIEKKIATVRAKKKGFSKLPHLENIYESPNLNPIIEGLEKVSNKNTKKSDPEEYLKNILKKMRDFVLNNAKYTNIFYDLNLLLKQIEKGIIEMYTIEKPKSAFGFFTNKRRKEFQNGILDRSDISITLKAEFDAMKDQDKQKYQVMAYASKTEYRTKKTVAENDAKILTANIRKYFMTFLGILMTYNILYTWTVDDGKEIATFIESKTKDWSEVNQFFLKPLFILLGFQESILGLIGKLSDIFDKTKFFLGVLFVVAFSGIIQVISNTSSKLMVKSLSTMLNGNISKSPIVYIAIIFSWIYYIISSYFPKPPSINQQIPLTPWSFIGYVIIIALHCFFLAPSVGFAISFYTVYRFILLIPFTFGLKIMEGFQKVDEKIREGIPDKTSTNKLIFENIFAIIFILMTIVSITDLGLNLKNQKLQIALPTVISALLIMFIKYKYDNFYENKGSDASVPSKSI